MIDSAQFVQKRRIKINKAVKSIKEELKTNNHTTLKRHYISHYQSDADLSEIAAIINSGTRFIAIKNTNNTDWDITRNPSFLKDFKRDLRSAVAGGIFSLLIGWLLWLLNTQSAHQENKQINRRIDSLSNKIDSLNKRSVSTTGTHASK